MQRQAPTPSHHWFSVGTDLQEAPTSVSYNWHLSSCNLIGKLQLPYSFKRKTLVDLPWISALFCTIFTVVHQSSYLPYIISASSQIHYQLLLLLFSAPPSSLHHCFISAFSNFSQHLVLLLLLLLFSASIPYSSFSMLTLSHLLQLSYFLQISSILLHTLFFSHSVFFDFLPLDITLFYTKYLHGCLYSTGNSKWTAMSLCLLPSHLFYPLIQKI